MVARVAPLVAIVGPTASGKSELAMQIAKKYNGELICADSRTVYKGLNIGTAKPSLQDRNEVHHHMLDIVEPDQEFTAARFKYLANKAIADTWSRERLPILVGGSGLYIDSVLFDYHFAQPANVKLRRELEELSVEQLQQLCRYKNIELPTNHLNKRHLIRTIEVGGILQQPRIIRQKTIVVGISTSKEELYSRIVQRARNMFDGGVVQEAQLLGQKYGWNNEAMKSNIYRVCQKLINSEISLEDAERLTVQSDMRLAKKQLTWFKRNPNIIWGNSSSLENAIRHFVCRQNR